MDDTLTPGRFASRTLVLLLATLAAGLASPADARQDCSPVRFQPGTSGTVIAGTAPPSDGSEAEQPLCYALVVGEGQNARVRLLSGRNVAITIPGVGDASDSFDFRTKRGRLELHVFQLFPGGDAEPFRIRVEVTGRAQR